MKAAYGYTFKTGASTLFGIEQSRERRYPLCTPVEYEVRFDSGVLVVRTEPGFVFDGRSGPRIVDWFAPNLGSLDERLAWHMHDCLGYAQSLDFIQTNYALKFVLRDLAAYSNFKAELIRKAVSLSKNWYGVPTPDDEWFCNKGKVRTKYYAYNP